MLFNSYSFIFAFLPAFLTICFLLAQFRGAGAAKLWIIVASLAFYGAWRVEYLPLLLLSIGFNYGIALALIRQPDAAIRRQLLILAAVVDLGLLAYYKYTGFLVGNLNAVAGTDFVFENLALPLGISFYTFQQLTLLMDIADGETTEINFPDFMLFVLFFPHLIAGPIVHHREMMPQFATAKFRPDWSNLAVGLTLFGIGLFKKAVLADGIGREAAPIFAAAAAGEPVSLAYAWLGAVGFVLQMYFDFSGYSEMALGLARMVGIRLPINFNSPLKATSVIAFWNRWHMTLTRFLTEYLYNPMARSAQRRLRAQGKPGLAGARTSPRAFLAIIAVPTVVTMFLSGLWHGAGNHFLVFGLLHGLFLVVNHAWRLLRVRFWRDQASYQAVMAPVGFVLTFLCVTIGMTISRADNLAAGLDILAGMAGLHGLVLPVGVFRALGGAGSILAEWGVRFVDGNAVSLPILLTWVVVLLVIALGLPNTLQILRDHEPAVAGPGQLAGPIRRWFTWQPTFRWAAWVAVTSVAGIFSLNQISEFLYWQF